ncbi:hypothetical protein RG959_12145 [Domibacillus sp. 8LH]|uniref:hypothetical protein n=1 Tax=Domibacillus TaxID=1433999 RepID=UPI00203EAED6|nr:MULTISPECIES: hypothetical protein [Domibacillus]MCM3789950.1 hypothetical protein [Domibacillus indicus]WNS78171.1 hypothetical protein RRU94_06810 [Domibacillus sp. DTU_2020_1001157_1_SI_ALB_TIR_016]
MSLNSLQDLLETLCSFNTINITHTFEKDEQPIASVCCLKDTSIIQLTLYETQSIKQYKSIEEAATAIDKLLN